MTDSPKPDPDATNENSPVVSPVPVVSGDSTVATAVVAPPIPAVVSPRRKGGLGTAAIVLGIVGIVFGVIPFVSGFGIFLGVVALVLGIIGLATHGSRAIAGTVLGGIALVLGVIFSVIYAVVAVSALSSVSDSYDSQSVSSSESPDSSKPAKPVTPAGTVSELQALAAARSYLEDGQGFSEAGLVGQLHSSYGNGFSKADAQWAVDHTGANWNSEAVIAAKSYISDGQGFSLAGLVRQLHSSSGSQFTKAQAEYGAQNSGADWNAQAVIAAKSYMELGGFSRSRLVEQLTSAYGSQFTKAQAEYAASKVGL